jgi:hypothetical protein
MTGPVLTRAEMRAFVLALLDVPPHLWWWDVISEMPPGVSTLLYYHGDKPRPHILAAADLLRPRWTREDAESAALNLPMLLALGSHAEQRRAYERVVRMITGEEP